MRTLYSFAIHCYHLLLVAASLFNKKARLWVDGRKNIFDRLSSEVNAFGSSRIVWFHCASLGEFEQGRPLIEKFKLLFPESRILLTFFSPSGYEVRKNYRGADLVFYLPIDSPSNAKRFIEIVNPKAAFFVKYEFWFNYLSELKERNVPVYLVSGIFRKDQHFFKPYGGWFREQLNSFSHFYLQDKGSEELLMSIGFSNITVVGDTRFDRVFEISSTVSEIKLVKDFKNEGKLLVLGSSWDQDEDLLIASGISGYKIVVAPHEISDSRIESIENKFKEKGRSCIRYSKADSSSVSTADVMIIDNIGMLSSLYQYGTIALIGGGFGKGIHNILEAATFGLPVIFGPNYNKFAEAKELIRLGGAFSVNDVSELNNILKLLNDAEVLKTASHVSRNYVKSRTGATSTILSSIILN
jgi:3-deoxy-D-manno-octulosonic-acid transferase